MDVGEKIKDFFDKNINKLNPYKRYHFAKRMYRLTGNERYAKIVRKYLVLQKKKFIADIKGMEDDSYLKKRSKEAYIRLGEYGTPEAQRKRKKVFRNKKERLLYFGMIEAAHWLNEAKAFSGRDKKYYSKWKKFLKSINLKQLLLDEGVFREFSAQLVNLVYYLRIDSIADLGKDFRKMFGKAFRGKLSRHMYINRIYTMTHSIIAGSDYYQRFVSRREFGWILDYFRNHIIEIINKTNPDVVFEVGLCFKLAGEKAGKEIKAASRVVEKEYNARLGYIPRKDKSLNKSEHANVMAIMLFSDFEKFYSGPRI